MIKRSLVVAFAGCWMAVTMQAAAGFGLPSRPNLQRPHSDASRGIWIADGEFVLAPMKFIRFCIDNPNDCEAKGATGVVSLDDDAWRELNLVNQRINARITPAFARAGQLDWSVTTTYGDCNDYAVQKRHELLDRGWPSSALSLAVVTTASGEGHLILTVRTSHGDVVLDNLRERIVTWNTTGYRFIKRQSSTSPKFWVEARSRGGRPEAQIIAIRSADKLVAAQHHSNGGRDRSSEPSVHEKNPAKTEPTIAEVDVDGATEVSHEPSQNSDALDRDTSL